MARKKKVEYKERILRNGEKRYDFDVSLGHDVNGERIRRTITAKTIGEGRDAVATLRINFNKNIQNKVKFETAHKAYIKDLEKKVKKEKISPETLKNKIAYASHYPFFHEYTLDKIDENIIESWQESIEHLANQTRNKYETELSVFFNWCIKKKLLKENPFIYVDITTFELEEMDFLTEDEFLEFIKHVDHEQFKLFLTLTFYTGLRFEEGVAISNDDEKEPHLLYLSHTRKGYHLVVSKRFKNNKSKRVVPTPVWLTLPKKEGFIFDFSDTKGDYIDLLKHYIKISQFKHFTFHTLRHSYISMCIEKGMDIYEIARYVGHTSTHQIERRYGHLYDKRIRNASTKFGSIDPTKSI